MNRLARSTQDFMSFWHTSKAVLLANAKARRRGRWDTQLITCLNHSNRKAVRATYVSDGHKRCNWCNRHTADGSIKAGTVRATNKRTYVESVQRRSHLAGRLYGIRLF